MMFAFTRSSRDDASRTVPAILPVVLEITHVAMVNTRKTADRSLIFIAVDLEEFDNQEVPQTLDSWCEESTRIPSSREETRTPRRDTIVP